MRTSDGRSTRLAAGLVVLLAAGAPLPARAQADKPIDAFWETNASVKAVTEFGGTLYIGGAFTYVGPSTGALARINATTGLPDLTFPKIEGTRVYALAPDGAGGWFLGGSFTRVGGLPRNGVAHVLADGRVSAWNPDVGSGSVMALAVSGRTVYVGGLFTSIGGQPRSNIAALDAATGSATTWNPGANNVVNALALSPSVVYAGGSFTTIGGQARNRIAALDRALDTNNATGWNPDASNTVWALALAGSAVYAGGQFVTIGGQTRRGIAALDSATGMATSWNPDATGIVESIALSANIVYVGGAFSNIGGQPRGNIAALDATLDTNNATLWNPNANNAVPTLVVSGGTIYAGGSFSNIGGQPRARIAALDAGTGNATPWNPSADDTVFALRATGGFVYAGGALSSAGGQVRNRIAALDATSGALTAWNPGADNIVEALAVSGSRVFAGGHFGMIGGQPRDRIAALDVSTGSAIAGWNPVLAGGTFGPAVYALDVAGGLVYAGGDFDTAAGQPRADVAAFDEATGGLTAWSPAPTTSASVQALKAAGGTVYAGGAFTYPGSRDNIVALDSGGTPTSWNPDASNAVFDLAVTATTVYAAGDFTTIGGATRNRIAALDRTLDTNNATAWDANANLTVNAVATAGSSVLAGGLFTTMNSPPQARSKVAALNDSTGTVRPWNPSAPELGEAVEDIAVGAGKVFVGGDFTKIGGQIRGGLAAFCLAGAPTGLNAAPAGVNRIDLNWTATGAPLYKVYRSRLAGGPYQLVGSIATPPFSDTSAEANIVYFYVVRGVDQCESDPSNEASASTPTGFCNLPPDFDGAAWAEQVASPTCAVQVGWAAASAPCGGGGIIYSIYRDTSPSFIPSVGNRIGTTQNTSFADAAMLAPGVPYYYIVRATSTSNGQEDTNTIRHVVTPITCSEGGPDTVRLFTVTSSHQENVLEWKNPPGGGSVMVKIHRTAAPPPCPLFATDGTTLIGSQSGPPDDFDTFVDGPSAVPPRPALSNGTTYCYTIWVEKSPSTFTAGQTNKGRPFDTTCPTCYAKWAYSLGIAALTSPGLGTQAGNAIHVVANDNTLRAIAKGPTTSGGGIRPGTFLPPTLDGPSQGRPTTILVSVTAGGGSDKAIFAGSQAGTVYAIDPDRGAILWNEPVTPSFVQASISGIFRNFPPGDFDYVFAATRVSNANNQVHALNKDDGSPVGPGWPFDGGIGGPIGIISGQPLVDYPNQRVYFTSFERNTVPAGDENTVWCVNIADATPCWSSNRFYGNIVASPTMRGDRIYVGTLDGRVIALSATDGTLAWQYDSLTSQPVRDFVLPDRASQNLYFSAGNKVIALTEAGDQNSAVEAWPAPGYVTITAPSAPIFLFGSTDLYLGDGNGRLHRLSTVDGAEIAPFPITLGDGNATVGAPTIDFRQDFLYLGTDAGIIYAVQIP